MMVGMADSVLLIALALGYIVCYLASRAEKTLKSIGYFIGVFVIIVSGLLILNNLVLGARFCKKMGGMILPQQKMMRGELPPAMPMPGRPQK